MKPVVFLDIDGVLNDHTAHPKNKYCTIDKAMAERFNGLLEATDAEFVVSSAWRYLVLSGSMTLEGFRNLLYSHWVDASRLVGVTRADVSSDRTDRGRQIIEWLGGLRGRPHLVIDDMDLGVTACHLNLFRTDGKVGLTDGDAELAIAAVKAALRRAAQG